MAFLPPLPNTGPAIPSDQPTGRCRWTKKSGSRCRMMVRHEEKYCVIHGGSSEAVILETKERLQSLAPLAVDVYEEVLKEEGEPCALCGRSKTSMKKMKAAQQILDRIGLGPILKVEHSGHISNDLLVERMTDEEIAAIDDIVNRAVARVQQELDSESHPADGGDQ